ncbi:MAG: DUF421 domain-containing protein [Firmicutes bacterium]|jgi:uncharacterized membrane protein YcaP (DUF421 family)|nr:DUF421 domain-containing protein [Bacillota bacterium]
MEPSVGLGLIHFIVSQAFIRTRVLERLLTHSPAVLVQNGTIIKSNLFRNRYTVDNLLSRLREKDVFDLSEVEFAVLEPSGNLSVLDKNQNLPVTPKDLGLSTQYKGLATPVVIEGQVQRKELASLHLTEDWLIRELKSNGYSGPDQVFLAMTNTQGELYVSPINAQLPPMAVYHYSRARYFVGAAS